MLQLKDIRKEYIVGDNKIEALRGISLEFRPCEFVSILGPSGCGKTTMLNIIGGLDHYTSGDLIISGRSTKDFKDKDWDSYRNHSIGFVFQSYNLIPHQSVLSNVELALTLSGVSKEERRAKAIAVLTRVGLKDHIYKRPNQLSGGQMQRVAIARALINDPEILLADEPTGALDSETSVQIMEILKEISKEKLIIMVTHNPDLAKQYSSRIIRALDGKILDDSNPYDSSAEVKAAKTSGEAKKKSDDKKSSKTSMSFFTALSLSFNNLLTKKGRTFLTAFAGSIGIIGIALILSLSHGMQTYINQVQEDTLSSYPITLQQESIDMSAMMSTMMETAHNKDKVDHEDDKVYSRNIMNKLLTSLTSKIQTNNLNAFKKYTEEHADEEGSIGRLAKFIQYSYNLDINIYNPDTSDGVKKINPSTLFDDMGIGTMMNTSSPFASMSMINSNVWNELIDNEEMRDGQYELVTGKWPSAYNEIIIITDSNGEISDYTLYTLGIMDASEIAEQCKKLLMGKEVEFEEYEPLEFTYQELLDLRYKFILNTDYYVKSGNLWLDKTSDNDYMKKLIDNAPELKVVGIAKTKVQNSSSFGTIGYTSDLTKYVIENINESEIAKEQLANPEIDVFTGNTFPANGSGSFDISQLTDEQKMYLASLSEEERMQIISQYTQNASNTYSDNISKLGIFDLEYPSTINIYAKDFEAKEAIVDAISNYNQLMQDDGKDEYILTYSDVAGTIMSSVTDIIDIISYVLISFVSISLVVSSIMIGIITYISVLERTKEIGILRSIGASKKDVSRVFNAETLIVGLVAGALGIIITLLLNIPINIIIENLTNVANIAILPWQGAVILILISIFLTMVAGLIPARMAAKKDPVEALRTE